MCNDITALKTKLQLFVGHMATKRFEHFEHLKERSLQLRQLADASVAAEKYAEKIKTLLASFQIEIFDFNDEEDNIAVFTKLFTFPTQELIHCRTIFSLNFWN